MAYSECKVHQRDSELEAKMAQICRLAQESCGQLEINLPETSKKPRNSRYVGDSWDFRVRIDCSCGAESALRPHNKSGLPRIERSHQMCSVIDTACSISSKGSVRSSSPFLTGAGKQLCWNVAHSRSTIQTKPTRLLRPTQCSTNKQRWKKLKESKIALARGFPPSSPACPRISR